ncbi:MAG: hypothetical protein LQ343_006526 [Gyalolechia ehrenbergii]|nr:MAG: hypothetical protein LQ343_006526 [Gyalolechia ehrenbergii]
MLGEEHDLLIQRTSAAMETYMSQPQFDASHDVFHVKRVLALARQVLKAESRTNADRSYDPLLIHMAALLHEIEDQKYIASSDCSPLGGTRKALPEQMLLDLDCPPHVAASVQQVINSISYTKERSDPQLIQNTLQLYPELAIVQDADRLDALGAVGIARAFAYGGVKQKQRGLEGTMLHFDEKLLNLGNMMKTREGKRLAIIRTERLQRFKEWWEDETREHNAIQENRSGLPE